MELGIQFLYFIPLVLSLGVHEWAHAAAANHLGDDTARLQGRLTLNPIAHMDLLGTVILPLLGVPFGWAKPVPFNPYRFHKSVNMRLGILLVAIAGPASNVVIATVCYFAMQLLGLSPQDAALGDGAFGYLLFLFFVMNISLAVFNMLPIPPLDGSKVVDSLMPDRLRGIWNSYYKYGSFVLLALLLLPDLAGIDIFGALLGQIFRLF